MGDREQTDDIFRNDNFQKFHKAISDLKLIFPFDWMSWYEGEKNLYNKNFDYSRCSLLELTMYITCIFRSNKFKPGTLEEAYNTQVLEKIFEIIKLNICKF